MSPASRPRWILPVIMVSQFAATSVWFAGNAVLPDLQKELALGAESVGWMTSSVMIGFIIGTLAFALTGFADRHSPRIIFLVSSILCGAFNLGLILVPAWWPILIFRGCVGVCLAGVYPIGMKIAAGWYREGLGKAIGFLVGSLVFGTALPHLVRALGTSAPWQTVILSVSVIAVAGGLLMAVFVPDGPNLRRGSTLGLSTLRSLFATPKFRASAFGYFGHMWELYTLWAFVPVLLATHGADWGEGSRAVSWWSFWVIAMGGVGCMVGGLVSRRTGSARVAAFQLAASGLCCLILPLVFQGSVVIYLAFLLFWGVMVAGDSPQFSTMNAQNAPPELVGSGLTIANSIGFALTVPSIELANVMRLFLDVQWVFPLFAIGPAIGLYSMRPLFQKRHTLG